LEIAIKSLTRCCTMQNAILQMPISKSFETPGFRRVLLHLLHIALHLSNAQIEVVQLTHEGVLDGLRHIGLAARDAPADDRRNDKHSDDKQCVIHVFLLHRILMSATQRY